MKQRVVDVVVISPPADTQMEKQGYRILARAYELFSFPYLGLGTHTRKIKEKPDEIRRVIKATIRANRFIRDNRDEAVRALIAWGKVEREFAYASYDALRNLFQRRRRRAGRRIETCYRASPAQRQSHARNHAQRSRGSDVSSRSAGGVRESKRASSALRSQQMIVDWHAHVYPPEMAKERRWGGTSPLTIENLLEAHEKAGIERCVVSNTIHYLKDKSNDESLAFLRRWNEYGAEIQQKFQRSHHRFHQHAALRRHAVYQRTGARHSRIRPQGVLINSSHQRAYPDDDEAKPFLNWSRASASR